MITRLKPVQVMQVKNLSFISGLQPKDDYTNYSNFQLLDYITIIYKQPNIALQDELFSESFKYIKLTLY